MTNTIKTPSKKDIAIIGVSGIFPKSENLAEFWTNLQSGKELSHFYLDDELSPQELEAFNNNHNYIRVNSKISGSEFFDFSFFDFTFSEARSIDPQIRIFLQQVWHAIEDSGYNPHAYLGKIGMYATASDNISWRVFNHFNKDESLNNFFSRIISDKSFLSLIPSYKFNLKGPSFSLDSACSSSLVAVHQACRSLLLHECSICIAGGIRIGSLKQKGYFFEEGSIYSQDGHCRPFDTNSNGTIDGEGVGIVVLKRLNEAIEDRDNIYAVIKASAVNNDGHNKVGLTAPSVSGQYECIKLAQQIAGIDPQSISYIEAHGTGTKLGDPIEIKALNLAFADYNTNTHCAIGSVKSNMGHLDSAAGIAGLIKTILSLKFKQIPPSINFTKPNPEIDFKNGPFVVNTKLLNWVSTSESPLRAGVNSYGVGGTNVHIILEEFTPLSINEDSRKYLTLLTSAKTYNSLINYIKTFIDFLHTNPNVNLADMCYTQAVGRQHFEIKKSFSFVNRDELIDKLSKFLDAKEPKTASPKNNKIIFMFPGQGSQYLNMCRDLYLEEPQFRHTLNLCFSKIQEITGLNYKLILFPEVKSDFVNINETQYAQPIIFIVEYSLAKLIMSFGVNPDCMIGHSIGEYVAACISGVIKLEDAIRLIIKRGEIMHKMEPGSMVSAQMSLEEAKKYISPFIAIAAINSSRQIVFSGEKDSINTLSSILVKNGIPIIQLQTTRAFHSHMLDNVLSEFSKELEVIKLNKPQLKYVSNLSGDFITEQEATSKSYWVNHMRNTVNFSKGLNTIISFYEIDHTTLVEIGPGMSLSNLAKENSHSQNKIHVINLVRHVNESTNDVKYFDNKMGLLWSLNVPIDWNLFYRSEKRTRISIPKYSFDKYAFPVEVDPFQNISLKKFTRYSKIDDWFYRIQWKQSIWIENNEIIKPETILIISNSNEINKKLLIEFSKTDHQIIEIVNDKNYFENSDKKYSIDIKNTDHWSRLFGNLQIKGFKLDKIIHLSTCDHNSELLQDIEKYLNIGYDSLLALAKSYNNIFFDNNVQIILVSNGLYDVCSSENIIPLKATVLAPIKAIPAEFPNIFCKSIDVSDLMDSTIHNLLNEIFLEISQDNEIAIRGKYRYLKSFEKLELQNICKKSKINKNGNYVITGASGAMAKIIIETLSKEFRANFILISRKNIDENFLDRIKVTGSNIYTIQNDLSDKDSIQEELDRAQEKLGQIQGVFHTAGVADFGGSIVRREVKEDRKIFKPKINGTLNLYSYFKSKEIDFFINFSSQSASLVPFGEIAYVASNLFLDSFSELCNNNNFPMISIEWTALQEIGMSVNSLSRLESNEATNKLKHGIHPSNVFEIITNAITIGLPVQIVSPYDFNLVTHHFKEEKSKTYTEPHVIKKRPDLSSDYEEGTSNTEIVLAQLFQNFLGIELIGVRDNLYELGVDSLKSMGIVKNIKTIFNLDIPLKALLENQTVKSLAKYLDDFFVIQPSKSKITI